MRTPFVNLAITPITDSKFNEATAVLHWGMVNEETGKAHILGRVDLEKVPYSKPESYTAEQIAASVLMGVALAFYDYVTPPAVITVGRTYSLDTPAAQGE